MGRVLTNNTNFAYAIESSLGVAGTSWRNVEPNEIGAFGAEISTVARNPISRNRQRRKGTVTDLDSKVEFEADLTVSSFRDFIEAFIMASSTCADLQELATTAAETTGDTYTVAALTAAQADKLEIDSLIWVEGFSNSDNNGLKNVDADIAAAATAISVEENLADEAAPPSDARLSFVGHRVDGGDGMTWAWSSPEATLTLAGIGTELVALGLTVDQTVHIGSIAAAGDTTVQNALENAAANDMYGYCRVKAINTDSIVFDKVDTALRYNDAAVATDVDLLFGEFFRNVATTDSDYLERSFTFEAEFPNLGAGAATEYDYAKGNYCNTVAFTLPLADKATASFAFIGTDTDSGVAAGSRLTGADSALDPTDTTAVNTTADIARLRIMDVDEAGLSTDFKELTLTIGNNVSPEKILGTLGAAYMNTGNFDVDIEAQLLFSNSDVITRIRNNTTVTMDFILKNDDGVISVDIPSMTLGGGDREFPENETVLVNLKGMAFGDETFGTSIGITVIQVPLP